MAELLGEGDVLADEPRHERDCVLGGQEAVGGDHIAYDLALDLVVELEEEAVGAAGFVYTLQVSW